MEQETHRLIEENLSETPTYGGWVDAKGPRYCPSIEDKIVRFKDKESHQIFWNQKAGQHRKYTSKDLVQVLFFY